MNSQLSPRWRWVQVTNKNNNIEMYEDKIQVYPQNLEELNVK